MRAGAAAEAVAPQRRTRRRPRREGVDTHARARHAAARAVRLVVNEYSTCPKQHTRCPLLCTAATADAGAGTAGAAAAEMFTPKAAGKRPQDPTAAPGSDEAKALAAAKSGKPGAGGE